MNKKLIIVTVVVLAGIVLLSLAWFFLSARKQQNTVATTSPVTLPASGSIPTPTPTGTSGNMTTGTTIVRALNGGTVTTSDFIHNGITLPDKTNAGRFILAGNLGYCSTNPQNCQAAPATDFTLYYDEVSQSFTVALTQEPIGQARLHAEQFLLTTLGIPQQQLCQLNYYVGATYLVNASYDNKNLGFSFCPGATVLPQ